MKILFLFQQNDICAIFYSDFFQTLISYCQQQPCTSSRLNLFSLFLILYSPVLFLEEKYPSEFLHLYLDIVLSDAPSYRRPPAFTQLFTFVFTSGSAALSLWSQLLQQWKPHTTCIFTQAFLLGFGSVQISQASSNPILWYTTSNTAVSTGSCWKHHLPLQPSLQIQPESCSWRLPSLLPALQLSEVTDILVLGALQGLWEYSILDITGSGLSCKIQEGMQRNIQSRALVHTHSQSTTSVWRKTLQSSLKCVWMHEEIPMV